MRWWTWAAVGVMVIFSALFLYRLQENSSNCSGQEAHVFDQNETAWIHHYTNFDGEEDECAARCMSVCLSDKYQGDYHFEFTGNWMTDCNRCTCTCSKEPPASLRKLIKKVDALRQITLDNVEFVMSPECRFGILAEYRTRPGIGQPCSWKLIGTVNDSHICERIKDLAFAQNLSDREAIAVSCYYNAAVNAIDISSCNQIPLISPDYADSYNQCKAKVVSIGALL